MKEIRLQKNSAMQIGNVRVSPELFHKIEAQAKAMDTSMQKIIRAILENFIDEVLFK